MEATFDYHAIRGVLPTVLTPYDDAERVDQEALAAEVRYLLDAGVHGLVLLGSFGESPYLGDADREMVMRTTIEVVAGRVPVVVGVTAESTFVAAEQIGQAQRLGAAAAMVCLPQYFAVEFAYVKRHYTALSGLKLLPIFYYHYPAATRLDLKPDRIAELLAIRGVIGIKESTFDMTAVKQHIQLTRKLDRVYLSGSELNFVQFMDLGGHGAVSAGSAVMPRTAVAMYEAYRAGDRAKAVELQSQLFETMPILKDTSAPIAFARVAFLQALRQGLEVPLGIESTHARVKAALARRDLPIKPIVRSPLRQLTSRDEQAVEQAMQKIEVIEPSPKKAAVGKRRAEPAVTEHDVHFAKTAERVTRDA